MRYHITKRDINGLRACLAGIAIQILLYTDDIVLMSDTPEGLQRHLYALNILYRQKFVSNHR